MILICAASLDHTACTPKTAIDIVRGPVAHTVTQCIQESQDTLAQTSIAPVPNKQYMKIVCESDRPS